MNNILNVHLGLKAKIGQLDKNTILPPNMGLDDKEVLIVFKDFYISRSLFEKYEAIDESNPMELITSFEHRMLIKGRYEIYPDEEAYLNGAFSMYTFKVDMDTNRLTSLSDLASVSVSYLNKKLLTEISKFPELSECKLVLVNNS